MFLAIIAGQTAVVLNVRSHLLTIYAFALKFIRYHRLRAVNILYYIPLHEILQGMEMLPYEKIRMIFIFLFI